MADIRNDQYLHRPTAGRGAITAQDPLEVLLHSGGQPISGTNRLPVEATLFGSNVPQKLAAGGWESVVYRRTGSLAAETQETVVDVSGSEVHLEALTVGTDHKELSLFIYPYFRDGTRGAFMGIAAPNGNIFSPGPRNLRDYSGGENDFFRLALYDETQSQYVVAMKRQARFGNGLRIEVRNRDSANPHQVAVNAMVYVMAPVS